MDHFTPLPDAMFKHRDGKKHSGVSTMIRRVILSFIARRFRMGWKRLSISHIADSLDLTRKTVAKHWKILAETIQSTASLDYLGKVFADLDANELANYVCTSYIQSRKRVRKNLNTSFAHHVCTPSTEDVGKPSTDICVRVPHHERNKETKSETSRDIDQATSTVVPVEEPPATSLGSSPARPDQGRNSFFSEPKGEDKGEDEDTDIEPPALVPNTETGQDVSGLAEPASEPVQDHTVGRSDEDSDLEVLDRIFGPSRMAPRQIEQEGPGLREVAQEPVQNIRNGRVESFPTADELRTDAILVRENIFKSVFPDCHTPLPKDLYEFGQSLRSRQATEAEKSVEKTETVQNGVAPTAGPEHSAEEGRPSGGPGKNEDKAAMPKKSKAELQGWHWADRVYYRAEFPEGGSTELDGLWVDKSVLHDWNRQGCTVSRYTKNEIVDRDGIPIMDWVIEEERKLVDVDVILARNATKAQNSKRNSAA